MDKSTSYTIQLKLVCEVVTHKLEEYLDKVEDGEMELEEFEKIRREIGRIFLERKPEMSDKRKRKLFREEQERRQEILWEKVNDEKTKGLMQVWQPLIINDLGGGWRIFSK